MIHFFELGFSFQQLVEELEISRIHIVIVVVYCNLNVKLLWSESVRPNWHPSQHTGSGHVQ
jgi:hypothetical protein